MYDLHEIVKLGSGKFSYLQGCCRVFLACDKGPWFYKLENYVEGGAYKKFLNDLKSSLNLQPKSFKVDIFVVGPSHVKDRI